MSEFRKAHISQNTIAPSAKQRSASAVNVTNFLSPRFLTLCVAALVATSGLEAFAQQPSAPATTPAKVGLIDMAHLFKEYDRFKDKSEELKADVQKSNEQAKQMGERMQTLANQIKSGTVKPNTPEAKQIEDQLVQLSAQFEAFKKTSQRDFLRKESQIYKEIYLEVTEAVAQYAKFYNYTLIIRFSRNNVDESNDPRQLIQSMNNLVIYHRPEFDITNSVLAYLNKRYQQTAGKPAATSTN